MRPCCILVALVLGALQAPPLDNGAFERSGERGAVPGWTVVLDGDSPDGSPVAIDSDLAHGGKACLRFELSERDSVGASVSQTLPVRPAALYRIIAWSRTREAGRRVLQTQDTGLELVFRDGYGKILETKSRRPKLPTADWHTLVVSSRAPEETRAVELRLFSSLNGTVWFDDVVVLVEGGHEVPVSASLVDEGFEGPELAPDWQEADGARTAPRGSRSTLAVDPDIGSPGSPGSLRLAGGADTATWRLLQRDFPVQAGEGLRLTAVVRGADLGGDGDGARISLAFFAAGGIAIRTPSVSSPVSGTFDWRSLAVRARVPGGAVLVRVALSLSQPGTAWFDRIILTRSPPENPADTWQTLASDHVTLRFPPASTADRLRPLADRLDAVYRKTRRALAVADEGPITVWLYPTAALRLELTDREADFVDVPTRMIHVSPDTDAELAIILFLQRTLGDCGLAFLEEGLLRVLQTEDDALLHRRAAALRASGSLPSFTDLARSFDPADEDHRVAAASLCAYLIQEHGVEPFKALCRTTDPRLEGEAVLGVHLEIADRRWRRWLRDRE